jgi:hypothetical protein
MRDSNKPTAPEPQCRNPDSLVAIASKGVFDAAAIDSYSMPSMSDTNLTWYVPSQSLGSLGIKSTKEALGYYTSEKQLKNCP